MIRFLIALILCSAPAAAETFRIVIAGADLGRLTYASEGGAADLKRVETRLSGTPLGSFDGTFSATSRLARDQDGATVRQYRTEPGTARSSRVVSVLLGPQGRVLRTDVAPAGDRTDVSDAAAVTQRVVDPVSAFGLLVSAGGCPAPITAYDGRRVVRLTVTEQSTEGAQTLCAAEYRVIAGAPHLSPLRLRTMDLTLKYQGGQLVEIQARTAIFSGRVLR